jgi:imidazolonepropionase-like amidohydrolase
VEPTLLLRGCDAVDARGPRNGSVDIVLSGNRVTEIVAAGKSRVPPDTKQIDARGLTVAPGLVNMHEHLGNAHPGTLEEAAIAGEGDVGCVLRMAGNAMKALRAGVTTMRLVGERDGLEVRIREAITNGLIEGPRIWTAGAPLDFKGGHGGTVGALEGDSPAAFQAFAQTQLDRGADLIKVMICGGGAGRDLDNVRVTEEEFLAIRSVAREANVKMSIHTAAIPHPIMELLIEDGLDSLEHCYLLSDELLRRCIDNNVLLVMTPLVGRSPEYFEAIELPGDMIANLTTAGRPHWEAVCRAVRSGARLALGTDFHSHLNFGGTWAVARELEVYEEAGADPLTILALASRNGAVWLGQDEELGLVEEGFLADLLLLERNPLTDGASAFREIRTVIADGRMFETRAPEEPVRVPVS